MILARLVGTVIRLTNGCSIEVLAADPPAARITVAGKTTTISGAETRFKGPDGVEIVLMRKGGKKAAIGIESPKRIRIA